MSLYLGTTVIAPAVWGVEKANTDFDNVTQTAKSNILKWGTPDYTAGISVSSGYQATKAGLFMFSSNTYSSNPTFSVNGSQVYLSQGYGNERMSNNIFIPLDVGDSITWSQANATTGTSVFYPYKGA